MPSDSTSIYVNGAEGERLDTAAAIVDATLDSAGQPLVGRTVIDGTRYLTTLEFPIKTMNASERDLIYQTDTGPVILPDFSREPDDLIVGFELAFVCLQLP